MPFNLILGIRYESSIPALIQSLTNHLMLRAARHGLQRNATTSVKLRNSSFTNRFMGAFHFFHMIFHLPPFITYPLIT